MPHLQQAAWRMCAVNPLASQAHHDGGWLHGHQLLRLTGPVPAHLHLIAQHRSLTLAVSRLTVMADKATCCSRRPDLSPPARCTAPCMNCVAPQARHDGGRRHGWPLLGLM